MTKTKEEQFDRVQRIRKLLRGYTADAMKSNASDAAIAAYSKACSDFVELLEAHESDVWK